MQDRAGWRERESEKGGGERVKQRPLRDPVHIQCKGIELMLHFLYQFLDFHMLEAGIHVYEYKILFLTYFSFFEYDFYFHVHV